MPPKANINRNTNNIKITIGDLPSKSSSRAFRENKKKKSSKKKKAKAPAVNPFAIDPYSVYRGGSSVSAPVININGGFDASALNRISYELDKKYAEQNEKMEDLFAKISLSSSKPISSYYQNPTSFSVPQSDPFSATMKTATEVVDSPEPEVSTNTATMRTESMGETLRAQAQSAKPKVFPYAGTESDFIEMVPNPPTPQVTVSDSTKKDVKPDISSDGGSSGGSLSFDNAFKEMTEYGDDPMDDGIRVFKSKRQDSDESGAPQGQMILPNEADSSVGSVLPGRFSEALVAFQKPAKKRKQDSQITISSPLRAQGYGFGESFAKQEQSSQGSVQLSKRESERAKSLSKYSDHYKFYDYIKLKNRQEVVKELERIGVQKFNRSSNVDVLLDLLFRETSTPYSAESGSAFFKVDPIF